MKIPSDQKIYQRVCTVIAEVPGQSGEGISPDSRLSDDLGMTSLDFVDLEHRIEIDFGIGFYHGSAVEKLEELLGTENLVEDGLLTPFGAAVLRLRLPEINPDRLREGEPAAGIEAMFTPRTWIRVVKELLNARPETCPHCESNRLEVSKPSILICKTCNKEVRCPDGEECLTAWAKAFPSPLESIQQSANLEEDKPLVNPRPLHDSEIREKSTHAKALSYSSQTGLRETRKAGLFGWSYISHGLAVAFVVLLIVAVPYLFWQGRVQENIFNDAIAQYKKVVVAPRTASMIPGDRLLDLSPWGYSLLSMQTQQVKGQERQVLVYQGQGKEYLLAQVFKGAEFSFPRGARVIRESGRDFVSHSQGGVNQVAWKDNDIFCILTSDFTKDRLLSLARKISMDS